MYRYGTIDDRQNCHCIKTCELDQGEAPSIYSPTTQHLNLLSVIQIHNTLFLCALSHIRIDESLPKPLRLCHVSVEYLGNLF